MNEPHDLNDFDEVHPSNDNSQAASYRGDEWVFNDHGSGTSTWGTNSSTGEERQFRTDDE